MMWISEFVDICFCFVGLNKEIVKNIENNSHILHKLKERSNFYA